MKERVGHGREAIVGSPPIYDTLNRAEERRVLRPDGELRFIEHVRGVGLRGRVQDAIKPVWKWLGAGCNPNRRTEQAIRAAGFDIVSLKREMLMPWMVPVITGVAKVGT